MINTHAKKANSNPAICWQLKARRDHIRHSSYSLLGLLVRSHQVWKIEDTQHHYRKCSSLDLYKFINRDNMIVTI